MSERAADVDSPWPRRREEMVRSQLETRGIRNSRVLAAMETVPREEFVPEDLRHEAYADTPLPIGRGQTISQPLTVAFMAQALQLSGNEKVLEIGTGCGYGAAVLARLAREVHTVERLPELAADAKERLARLRFNNVYVHEGDGSLGWRVAAPYEAICVTAAAESVPQALLDQLAEGGRLLIPVGATQSGQQMMRYTLLAGTFHSENLGAFSFVPLISGR